MKLRWKLSGRGVHRGRRFMAAAVSFVVVATTFVMALGASTASAAPACRIDYSASNWGSGGFTGNVTVNNLGDPITNWTLTFTFPGTQRVSQGWNATWTQAAGSANVTATSMSYNGTLATGASTQIGFNGTFTGTNTAPTSFSLNGVACTGQPPTDPGDPGNPPPAGNKVDNPYAGAGVYVNPDWSALAAAEPGGSRISNQPTGVWLDR